MWRSWRAASGVAGASAAITFAAPENATGAFLKGIPPQFYDALPYLVTIIILAGLIGRSVPPAADGQPYQREASA